mmetsp:Transcript_10045/g.12639  ORF Transcript_10045/g.12639 Transcript_10045/m.12639 type:complete len:97 (-) Transcript_10045:87-377(-)
MANRATQVGLSCLFHFPEDESPGLRRGVPFAIHLHPSIAIVCANHAIRHCRKVFLHVRIVEPAPDETLRGKERALRISDRLSLSWRSDEALSVFCE